MYSFDAASPAKLDGKRVAASYDAAAGRLQLYDVQQSSLFVR
jgi:hypothetical protein